MLLLMSGIAPASGSTCTSSLEEPRPADVPLEEPSGLRLGPTSGESQRWLPDLVGSRTASWHILVLDCTESRRERELVLGGDRTNEPPTPANAPFKLRP